MRAIGIRSAWEDEAPMMGSPAPAPRRRPMPRVMRYHENPRLAAQAEHDAPMAAQAAQDTTPWPGENMAPGNARGLARAAWGLADFATPLPSAYRAGAAGAAGDTEGALVNGGMALAGMRGLGEAFSARPAAALPRRAPVTEPVTPLPQSPLRELGRASDGSVLPIRPGEPFRRSFTGGSADLADAAAPRRAPQAPDAGGGGGERVGSTRDTQPEGIYSRGNSGTGQSQGPLFHWSPNEFDTFDMDASGMGVHVGSRDAARARARGASGKTMALDVTGDNWIDVPDMGTWGGRFRDPWYVIQQLPEGTLTSGEIDAVLEASGDRIVALREMLARKGYTGFRYANEVEAPGSVSYAVFDPANLHRRGTPRRAPDGGAGRGGSGLRAAVRDQDTGQTYTGDNHFFAAEAAEAAGARNIDHAGGFVDQAGNYLTREEAAQRLGISRGRADAGDLERRTPHTPNGGDGGDGGDGGGGGKPRTSKRIRRLDRGLSALGKEPRN